LHKAGQLPASTIKAHSQTNRVFFMAQRGAGAAENVLEWLETLRDDEDVWRTTFCHMPAIQRRYCR
jgi:hypothetical protein